MWSMLTDGQYFGLAIIVSVLFLFVCVIAAERLQIIWRGRYSKRVLRKKRLIRRMRA